MVDLQSLWIWKPSRYACAEALYEDAATERERDAIRRRMDMMS